MIGGILMSATPKPASTVVLMDHESRVYLTKRPLTMKFMGGFHVFPGGAVEKADYVKNSKYIINNVHDHSVSLANYIAAARELFEEIGILLGNKLNGSPPYLSNKQVTNYRRMLIEGEISFTHVLEEVELYFDLQCLTYFGQIITPEEMPIRFDTRFFLAELPKGQNPDPDQREIDEGLWITPDDALKANLNKEIKLAPPTIISLQTIIKFQNGGDLMMSVKKDDLLKLLKEIKK
jgi:8-oxo-dGTP pyrophosphatase MutT (NUDIX family)